MERLGKDTFDVGTWPGGRTVQIAIGPAGARYADRTFLWRVSSATVELDESDFTPLPGYDRWIILLSGEMSLSHDGSEPEALERNDAYPFDGAAATRCWGRCTDFGLMLRKGACRGTVFALVGDAGEERSIDAQGSIMIIYCVEGGVTVSSGGPALTIGAGEAVRIDPSDGRLTLRFDGAGRIAAAEIREGGP